MEPTVRIRLEGADEVLAAFRASCGRVRSLLGRGWRPRLRSSTDAAELASAQGRLARARASCAALEQHPDVRALLTAVHAAERKLEAAADKALGACGDHDGGSLQQKLYRLCVLARPLKLDDGERTLLSRRVSGGTVTMTQSRDLFESDGRASVLAPDDPLLRPPLLHLLSRLRGALGVSGPPLVEPGASAVVEVFRFSDDDGDSSPGLMLCWKGGLLFAPHHNSARLPAALLGEDQPVDVTDTQLLETLALVLPWAATEVRRRLVTARLDWCWPRGDLIIDGAEVWRQGRRAPWYRVIQGLEEMRRGLEG